MMETQAIVMVVQAHARLNQVGNVLALHAMEPLTFVVLNLQQVTLYVKRCAVMDHFRHQMVNSVMITTLPQEMDAQVLARLKQDGHAQL